MVDAKRDRFIRQARQVLLENEQIQSRGEPLTAIVAEPSIALLQCLGLMSWSPLHRTWTVADVERLVWAPIQHGMMIHFLLEEECCAFFSYALLDERAEALFLNPNEKLPAHM